MKTIAKLLMICMCFTYANSTKAQTIDKKWNIGFHGGWSQYRGDLGNDYYRMDMPFYGVGGLYVSRYLGSHFDVSLLATKGTVGFNRPSGHFRDDFSAATFNFRFNLLGPESFIRPYVFAGGGVMLFDKNLVITEKKVDYIAPSCGAGLNIKMGPSVMLNFQENFLYSGDDNRDHKINNENDAYLFHMVGLTFNFGHKKDEDKDGVADRYDKCSNTPKEIAVNKSGCPFDADMDGVYDYLDKCVDLAGLPSLNGCPDRDNDGVADKDDECPDMKGLIGLSGCPDEDADGIPDYKDNCPNVKGVLALNGCPDRDADGVADNDDNCPDVKGLATFKGCPDSDGDGIEDSKDMCPYNKGTEATNGCPDTDNDGIHDGIDKCPKVAGSTAHSGCPDSDNDGVYDDLDKCVGIPGVASNQGCPELKKEVKQLFQKALQGIVFETGKAIIKPVSFPILDAIAKVMKDNTTYRLLIGGHTDNVGEDAMNMTLSQDRATAVANYLIIHGTDPLRITATGYGESVPVDTNDSEKGRARNRRVEFNVEYVK